MSFADDDELLMPGGGRYRTGDDQQHPNDVMMGPPAHINKAGIADTAAIFLLKS